jgi:hypothetical protein
MNQSRKLMAVNLPLTPDICMQIVRGRRGREYYPS